MHECMSNRTLDETINTVSNSFPVLLLTRPRQVGKATLLEHCANTSPLRLKLIAERYLWEWN